MLKCSKCNTTGKLSSCIRSEWPTKSNPPEFLEYLSLTTYNKMIIKEKSDREAKPRVAVCHSSLSLCKKCSKTVDNGCIICARWECPNCATDKENAL